MRQETVGLGDAVASAGPTSCIPSAPRSRQITTPTPHHSIFAGPMLFPTFNQQYQSTEGYATSTLLNNMVKTNKQILVIKFSKNDDSFSVYDVIVTSV